MDRGRTVVTVPLLGLAAPVLDLVGVLEPVAALDEPVGHALGFALFFAGLAWMLLAQAAIGTSWRIGVDKTERTDLVTSGSFALVRNPIFSAIVPTFLGLALLVPNAAALAGLAALVAAIQIQFRFVEEPYLRRMHDGRYAEYAAKVGRFAPGLGLLRRRMPR